MQTQLVARHFSAQPEHHDLIADRLGKLERVYDGITSARVVMDDMSNGVPEKTVEVNLNVYQRHLQASETASTFETALDGCTKSLRRQLKRYKARLRSHHRDRHR